MQTRPLIVIKNDESAKNKADVTDVGIINVFGITILNFQHEE